MSQNVNKLFILKVLERDSLTIVVVDIITALTIVSFTSLEIEVLPELERHTDLQS